MDLSDSELELIARNTGAAITSITQKIKRGVDAHAELKETRALLSRVLEEQMERGRASA
jgi:hypothetical protein